ncbi:hypothetical protein NEUTE1DRAFT_107537 [Neurospora tetrasperma FGSC 2508]|uniref:Carbonic anhydrase n=1 Tax=Neurospora tetrasperma (strain FGSC 2508 / ATCC MYA-4615 / P0657) TaxID=510951 RepID=F8MAP8_NEUT8|nr:uncharacterized protein NEUTE1DRAFT_107537 [Neurospora tetrasperma FGSC 2508]EGO60971.1 hypothetical protein NEUTE1DRAFT_107537 [Neurospora tetrasperma FGSC 2508]EGZ75025.1 hypothetical protein NEUTE2DRAFT_55451 [Neurospora tetrasperma FGSC 2509]
MPVTNEEIATRSVAASASYYSTFDKGHLAFPPAKKYISNAGASDKDALLSIVISQQLLATEAIVIVKHTGCGGMLTCKNEDAHGVVERNLGAEARKELEERKLDFLPFPQLKQAIQDDVEFLRGTKLMKNEVPLSGWAYDVETGKTVRVV